MLDREVFIHTTDGQEPIRRYIKSPLSGDLSNLHRESHRETGTLVIDAMRDAFAEREISYTTEEMMHSIATSLQLTSDQAEAIIHGPFELVQTEKTFLGLVYAGSKHGAAMDGFAEALRLKFNNLGTEYAPASLLDVLFDPHRGIEEVVGRYHYAFDSGLPLTRVVPFPQSPAQ